MPSESPSVYQRKASPARDLEAEARLLAQQVVDEWTHSPSNEANGLVDGLQRAFLEEANHSLRQVLFQLGARVELALVKTRSGRQGFDEETATNLLEALSRAAQIVDVYLDRSKTAQYAITLHPEPLRLDEDIKELLKLNRFLEDPDRVKLDLSAASVVADRERLRDVLGHLVSRFWFSMLPDESLVVRLGPTDHAGAKGFVGISRSHLRAEDLIEEINDPLSIEAVEIDLPYTRAVFERHGGSFYVASEKDGTIGFGFTLPDKPRDPGLKEEQHIAR